MIKYIYIQFIFIQEIYSFWGDYSPFIEDNLTVELRLHIHDNVHFPCYLGNPPQFAFMSIDLLNNYSTVSTFHYKKSRTTSKKIIATKQKIPQYLSDVELIEDSITLNKDNNVSKINITFYLVDTGLEGLIFGLHFIFYNEDYSIVHQYKKRNLISKLAFSFIPYKDKFFFHLGGEIPSIFSEGNNNYINKGICVIGNYHSEWGCQLNKIQVRNDFYYINKYAIFTTTEDSIIVSKEIMSFFMDKIFNKYINEDICSYTKYPIGKDREYYRCRCNKLNYTFPNITIYLGDYIFILEYKDVFNQMYNSCGFIFEYNLNLLYDFMFGISFIKKYTTIFDYEDKTITFYSDIKEIKRLYKNNTIIKGISILIIFSLITMSIVLFIKRLKLCYYA